MSTPTPLSSLVAAALALACATARADGENVVKVGLSSYTTHEQTSDISGIGVPPGAGASVDNASTMIFVYERLVTPNVGVEFVMGIPPRLTATATGSAAFLGDVLSAKSVSPTLLLNYHFLGPDSAFRPYLGVGINYTHFSDIKSSLAPDVQMSNSTGLALQAGLTYAITKDVGLFASVAKIKVKSDVVAVGSTVLQTTIDFRPIVYSLGVAYQF